MLVILAFVFFITSCAIAVESDEQVIEVADPGSAEPLHIYYGGKTYIFRGKQLFKLPEEFTYVSSTNNVGNMEKTNDFECNEDGYVYINPLSPNIVLFTWKHWETHKRYLVLEAE